MFGFSPDFSRGLQEQQFRDTLAGRQQQRQGSSVVSEWQRYARELEERLAQAEAETKAARVQRDQFDNRIVELQEALQLSNPKHPLCDEVRMRAENRAEIDRKLAQSGIRIDRSGSAPVVVRTG